MWIAHLLLFRGNSFAEWIGLHCGAKYRGFAFQFAFAGKSKSLAERAHCKRTIVAHICWPLERIPGRASMH